MKAKTIFLLAGLAFSCACRRPSPLLIPEISPPLIQEEVFSWPGLPAGNGIFACAGGIGWVDGAGGIVTWDPGKKSAGPEIRLPFPVQAPLCRQGELLVLGAASGDALQIYDLAALQKIGELSGLGAGRILGVDRDSLVYLAGANLVVNRWASPGAVFRLPAPGEKYFNCHFSPQRILILGRERLYIFSRVSGEFTSRLLPQPAASPFLLDGDHIYYGSSRRFLVKLSLLDNDVAWKLKLGQVLKTQPLLFAGSVIAGTADHSILQVNRRGSILWWQALGSIMNFDLVPMADHLAAFLLNGAVKFFDPRRQRVTEFKITGRALGQPLPFARDVYFMIQAGEAVKLQRVGNRYGIDIELEPAAVRWPGQSVRFALQPHNLIEPALDCVIRDAAGEPVFSKSMKTADRVSLAWMPALPGRYRIRVRARAQNRSEEHEISVHILDPQRPLPGFYLHF